jgi:hypothetical protein
MSVMVHALSVIALAIIKVVCNAGDDAWLIGLAILMGANMIGQVLEFRLKGR